MKKVKAILAGLVVVMALMFGVVFTGASVSNSSAVAALVSSAPASSTQAQDMSKLFGTDFSSQRENERKAA